MEQESTTKHYLRRSLNQSFSKENVKGNFKMEQASPAKEFPLKQGWEATKEQEFMQVLIEGTMNFLNFQASNKALSLDLASPSP